MDDNPEFARLREQMVTWQIQHRGIHAERVLEAMRRIPRHWFVAPEHQSMAYEDHPLPIGWGQTISQPYIVALMTGLLDLNGDERVLEIGCGSGYQAAILGCLAREVHSLEIIPALAQQARQCLEHLELKNVHIHNADGSLGWPEAAPFERVLISAAAPHPPQPVLEQMAEDGKLVLPVGSAGQQTLQRWQRNGASWQSENLLEVAFVPMRGKLGWNKADWPD